MKCLILGDVHLGRSVSIGKASNLGRLNSRVQDQVDLLDWAHTKCIDENIKYIIITGDVYHDFRPHPAIIGIFMRWLKKCEKANIEVHIVMGNHDIIRSGNYIVSALDLVSELELPGAIVHKNMDCIDIGNFSITFIPFRDKRMYEVKTKEEALDKFEKELKQTINKQTGNKIKVAVGHIALEGSMSIGDEISDQLNELYVPLELFDDFKYVWMGHIHHPQVIQHEPHIAQIGSLDKSDFSKLEVENDKIAILLNNELENNFEEIIIPTRPLRPVKIEVPVSKNSTEFVVNELCLLSKKLDFDKAIVRLDIQLNGADLENVDRKKIESYLYNNLNIHHICGFTESRSISSIQIDPEDSFDNTMELCQTINKWADTRDHFEDDQEREEFRTAAHELRAEYEEKYIK
ncbi:MAG: metallophosphoesterase [Clostridia bacterium]|jgi:exonuclease SbcD